MTLSDHERRRWTSMTTRKVAEYGDVVHSLNFCLIEFTPLIVNKITRRITYHECRFRSHRSWARHWRLRSVWWHICEIACYHTSTARMQWDHHPLIQEKEPRHHIEYTCRSSTWWAVKLQATPSLVQRQSWRIENLKRERIPTEPVCGSASKKLSYRRGTARRTMSLSTAAQLYRNTFETACNG